MDDQKQQLLAKLRDSANVLVTVTANPSVDQLAGAIGLTMLLNKLSKHATAIFSGQVPQVMEFLQPENTLEKNTDGLRDFIIALDKAKADKLRYKVEDTVVKIFITPYHTALTEKDLVYSQGDYNVDLIVALGAHQQQDLDQAIVSHGQILHDAVVSSVNNEEAGNLGTINWVDATASSLCEMIYDLVRELQPEGLDAQMATALLTGIVYETGRFGNDKTTAKSLETSSLLVAAGANQQLVAVKLEEHPAPIPEKKSAPIAAASEPITASDTGKDPEAVPQTTGVVTIDHKPEPAAQDDGEIHIDDQGQLHVADEVPKPPEPAQPAAAPEARPASGSVVEGGSRMILEPPTLAGQFNESSAQAAASDPLAPAQAPSAIPLLSHASGPARLTTTAYDDQAGKTLSQIETSVDSPHTSPAAMPSMSFTAPAADQPAQNPTPPPVPPPMMPDSIQSADQTAAPSDSQNSPALADAAL